MKYIYVILVVTFSVCWSGCSSEGGSDKSSSGSLSFSTEEEARNASPVGEVCVYGEIEEVFVPDNRGRGNNNGHWETVDNREFEPAYLRMDVNYDGLIDEADASLAIKQIYIKQIESEKCPAVADIGTFPQGFGPDQFYTSEDIYQWKEARRSRNVMSFFNMLNESDKLVCLRDCAIVNHMAPGNKR